MRNKVKSIVVLGFIFTTLLASCTPATTPNTITSTNETTLLQTPINRLEAIPPNAIKITPETDSFPPYLHSDKYQTPVPLGSGINTAGGEDAPFIMPDGNTLYFFFTPDVNIPAETQVTDGVTGIYVSHKQGSQWLPAERVILQDKGKLSMDGAECIQGNMMWFATARAGNFRNVDIWTAEYIDGRWQNWRNAGARLNAEYQIGEMHITADGDAIYFHAPKTSGSGDIDIFMTRKVNGEWQESKSINIINSAETEGWPFVSQDGNELWFLRTYQGTPAIFVSYKVDGQWSTPELIISQFAGEPSVDNAGNIYFVHHFYKDGKMIEADIYMAYRK